MEKKFLHKPKTFQIHFKDYCIGEAENGKYNKDKHNFDKMRFWVGVGKKSINYHKKWYIYIDDPNNGEYIISVKFINSGGNILPN